MLYEVITPRHQAIRPGGRGEPDSDVVGDGAADRLLRRPGNRDRHEEREIAIFRAFTKVCDISINPNSIEKKRPPEPDIQCEVMENGPLRNNFV